MTLGESELSKDNDIYEKLYEKLFENNFDDISFELTRKCNFKCKHCMRGDAQNITMSKEVIDNFFAQTTYILKFLVTGGEPFIDEEIFEYMVESIIKNKICINGINIISNGSIRSERIANAINRLIHYCGVTNRFKSKFFFYLGFSDDLFHLPYISENEVKKTVQFYRDRIVGNPYTELKIDLMSKVEDDRLNYYSNSEDIKCRVQKVGRAKDNNLGSCVKGCMNHKIEFETDRNDFTLCGEHIKIPFVKCQINIFANGNWGLDYQTFADEDKYAIGNILTDEENITKMIKKYNQNKCICTCKESSEYLNYKYMVDNDYWKDSDGESIDIFDVENIKKIKKKYEEIFGIREQIREYNPEITLEILQEKSLEEYERKNVPLKFLLSKLLNIY